MGNLTTKFNRKAKPLARRNGLVVKKLNDEVLVYDLDRQNAHCLNHSAYLIWEHCDGNLSINQLSDFLDSRDNISKDEREQIVWITLSELAKSDLLEKPDQELQRLKGLSRRQLIKAAGIASLLAIPVVSTIVAPTAAQASTCLASGQGCGTSAECCSGLCSVGTCV